MDSGRIARAIDVGYGETKYTTTDGRTILNGSNEIRCAAFPSVAPPAYRGVELEGLGKRATVVVAVEGAGTFEVGPDAMKSTDASTSRQLNPDFSETDQYLALLRGAMFMMNVDRIDHLVIGLPISTLETRAKPLEERVTGEHKVCGRRIVVGNCKCVAQPVGGLYAYGIQHHVLQQISQQTNLVIDPGYFTLDWVLTDGTKAVMSRSSAANNSGVAAYLRAVMESIRAELKSAGRRTEEVPESQLNKLDRAIREGSPFVYMGQPVKLAQHLKAGSRVVTDGLAKMREKLGAIGDIENIVLVGGGAHIYEDAVRAMFPTYAISRPEEARFANVRGFQLIANRRSDVAAAQARASAEV